jgi:hypothetical protein
MFRLQGDKSSLFEEIFIEIELLPTLQDSRSLYFDYLLLKLNNNLTGFSLVKD